MPTARYWRPSGAMNTRTPPVPNVLPGSSALSSVPLSGAFCDLSGEAAAGADATERPDRLASENHRLGVVSMPASANRNAETPFGSSTTMLPP